MRQNLGKCVTAVNQLNRNIEDVTSVDGGFSAVYSTWSRFQRALETGSYADSVRRLSLSFLFPKSWTGLNSRRGSALRECAGSTASRDPGAR